MHNTELTATDTQKRAPHVPERAGMGYREWYGLYAENWGDDLTQSSFAHPAKVTPALARALYELAFEQGWLKEGDRVIDPFAGIGGFARHAMQYGLHFLGSELEQRFVGMAMGVDCPGFTKEDWWLRPGRVARGDDGPQPHLCPTCAKAIDGDPADLLALPSADPHHFEGNIEMWNRRYAQWFPRWGTAQVIQGDSRRLLSVLGRAEGSITSPPYNLPMSQDHNGRGGGERGTTPSEPGAFARYGNTPGQLEGLPPGDYEAALSSPPYASGEKGHPSLGSVNNDDWGSDGRDIAARRGKNGRYGDEQGNIANLPEGSVGGALSSPPYADSVNQSAGANDTTARRQRKRDAGIPDEPVHHGGPNSQQNQPQVYGNNQGQLGAMKDEGLDAALSSPPYADSVNSGDHGIDWDKMGPATGNRKRGDDTAHGQTLRNQLAYTDDGEGNLGAMKDKGFEGAVSSPPFGNSEQSRDGEFTMESTNKNPSPRQMDSRTYYPAEMETEGQLGNMPVRRCDASITSPPWEDSNAIQGSQQRNGGRDLDQPGDAYALSEDNVGQKQGETFWTAARKIVEQTFLALRPGAVAIWVTGDYVRDGERVTFGEQWLRLCEAVGFEPLEWIVAWKVEPRGTQLGLFGDHEDQTVERISFFRRLANRNNPEAAIRNEDVIIVRKPQPEVVR